MATARSNATSTGAPAGWGRAAKNTGGVILVLHLTAVIVCPLSIEGSPIAGRLWLVVQPYVQAAYLNHGYHFFAPQPGPSHLLRYEVELADGTTRAGVIPNVKQSKPRVF